MVTAQNEETSRPLGTVFESDGKMVIYRVRQLRVLMVAILLTATAVLVVVVLDAPRKCVRVSVSVRQWRPHPSVKRTRAVRALQDSDLVSTGRKEPFRALESAWFRTRIVLPDPERGDEGPRTDDDEEEEDVEAGEYYGDDLPENKIFEEGDFDYNDTYAHHGSQVPEPDFGVVVRIFQKLENVWAEPSPGGPPIGRGGQRPPPGRRWRRNITLVNVEGVPIVEDGIFWSDELETRAPKGATDEEVQSEMKKLRSLNIHRVEPPTWNRCGRPKNQFVVFEDGSKACARYRAPHQYLVQGEVLSFYLSRLLGIHNIPAVSLAAILPDFQGMWSKESVKKDLVASKWEINTTVALIHWIEDLERDKMPPMLVSCLENKVPLSAKSSHLLTLLTGKLTELLQWSDLIVFDYITGNYDRVASMQDAADKESKPSILHETVHNLVRSKSTGGLWLIDNESGILDSYSLLYGVAGKDGRFVDFHRRMLNTTCLFRRHTANRIRWLHASRRAGPILMELVKQLEPLYTPVKQEKEVNLRLQQRIAEVHKHIERCQAGTFTGYEQDPSLAMCQKFQIPKNGRTIALALNWRLRNWLTLSLLIMSETTFHTDHTDCWPEDSKNTSFPRCPKTVMD